MYKLFLCLRYLRRRALAYFAALGVAMCVWLMLTAVSVMSGFLHKIEMAAKGLFGDIVVESTSQRGLGRYDEFISEVVRKVDEVEAGSPFIITLGILGLPGTQWQQTVQVAGIRLPQRAAVTDFENGLFVQAGVSRPTFDPPIALARKRLTQETLSYLSVLCRQLPVRDDGLTAGQLNQWVGIITPLADRMGLSDQRDRLARHLHAFYRQTSAGAASAGRVGGFERWLRALTGQLDGVRRSGDLAPVVEQLMRILLDLGGTMKLPSEKSQLLRWLDTAISYHSQSQAILSFAEGRQGRLSELQDRLDAALAQSKGEPTDEVEKVAEELKQLEKKAGFRSPAQRMILGLGIAGLSSRTEQGRTIRYMVPGQKLELAMVPLGRLIKSAADVEMIRRSFTVIDDSKTDVSSIDTEVVYVPFRTLQELNKMSGQYDADTGALAVLPRCTQIHLKVAPPFSRGRELRRVCANVRELWDRFSSREENQTAAGPGVTVQTWRQRQKKVVEPIEKQRTLTWLMFGIISLVSVVLILVIFYMIVVQKTRDIGIIKAVGGSNVGVAWIFLVYGGVTGLIGSLAGALAGWATVRNINPIQDWVDRWFRFRVWSKDTFLFEEIPNEVDWTAAAIIIIGSIVAGLAGAMIAAMRAARLQPVEALRYE